MKLALTPIVEQLRAAGLRNVDGLLEFSAQVEAPRALPAYFVVPTAETARGDANDRVGALDQKVTAGFSVMTVLEAARRHKDGVHEDLKIETGKVVDALLGWTHPEASGRCSFAGGRLASADGRTVVWETRFTSPYHLRKAS